MDRIDRDRLREGSVQPGQHLVGLGLGRRAGVFGPDRIIRVDGHLTVVTSDGLVHGEHGERHVTDGRLVHGPFQGALGMAGTVHSDDDSRHFLLLQPTGLSCPFTIDVRHAGPVR
jgi:hypothetical protein